ncbi:MAG: N-acetyl-gamma-glutamyl-phosphate reductase [Chloroflexota bacterium]|nr:MAG: N-acetyl-gamma-glutamyl-phosphate reductase [Chloroflexota bacterium]
MSQIKVGIINVTGYAGVELARLLSKHPKVKLGSITGRSAAGQKLIDIFPHLCDIDMTITAELDKVDFAFSAMPHKASAEVIIPLVKRGIKIVDISADFRLKDAGKYPQWYDFVHPAPELLKQAVYGLPELHRTEIAKASLVASTGCYPTGALLALAPVIKEDLIEPDIIIDSKSGVSGAGRTLSLSTHYAEAVDNVRAYSVRGHRHLPEIVQELEALNTRLAPSVTFVPHLVPMSRGILSSCYAKLKAGKAGKGEDEVIELYRAYYKGDPFIRVVDKPPETKQTWGSNLCLIYPVVDVRTNRLMVISCLDNLVKGAAGQAVQNMNIMLGFPETDGLEALPLYP